MEPKPTNCCLAYPQFPRRVTHSLQPANPATCGVGRIFGLNLNNTPILCLKIWPFDHFAISPIPHPPSPVAQTRRAKATLPGPSTHAVAHRQQLHHQLYSIEPSTRISRIYLQVFADYGLCTHSSPVLLRLARRSQYISRRTITSCDTRPDQREKRSRVRKDKPQPATSQRT